MVGDRASVERIIRDFAKAVSAQGVRPEKILLFGSYARGDPRPESDIDVIVVSPDFNGMPARRRWNILGKAAAAVMEPVEALALSPEELEEENLSPTSFLREALANPTVEYRI